MSTFWFSSVILVFAVLCKNYIMTEAHPGHTTDCDQLVLIDTDDDCKMSGNFSFKGDCFAYFECNVKDGNTTGYRRECPDGNVFNGSHCVSEPKDDKTKEQVCPELKCNPTSIHEGRDDIPHGLQQSTETPSTTAKQSTGSPSTATKGTPAPTPSGGNEVQPQMMIVSCVILSVLLKNF